MNKYPLIPFLLLVWLLLPGYAVAQTPIGTPGTLDIATWNIEWFGHPQNGPSNDDLQIENVASIIAASEVDLWGVQEIADPNDFDLLLDLLGDDYDGILATNSVEQRIGFIFDTRVIAIRQQRHILESFLSSFAGRPPLLLEANVTLPDTSVVVHFIVVHMKAFGDSESYDKREDASLRLKNNIDFGSLFDQPVVVLGDFNDELDTSTFAGIPSPYTNLVEDTDNYLFTTQLLDGGGEGTFCRNSSCSDRGAMLDHILITNELFDAYEAGSTALYLDATTSVNGFGASTSDHVPVYARFNFATGTATENLVLTPEEWQIYPSPTRSSAYMQLKGGAFQHVSIDRLDLLGRTIETLHSGPIQDDIIPLASQNWASGTYVLRLVAGNRVAYRLFTKL